MRLVEVGEFAPGFGIRGNRIEELNESGDRVGGSVEGAQQRNPALENGLYMSALVLHLATPGPVLTTFTGLCDRVVSYSCRHFSNAA